MALTTRSSGLTDVGCVRKKNEDSYIVDDHVFESGVALYVVADGMGGHAGGDVASAEAIDQIFAMVKRHKGAIDALQARDSEDNRGAVKRAVEAAVQAATYMVFGIAEQDPARKGMGTTISCMLYVPTTSGALAIVGQVGDSRVYLIRDGIPVQLTEDHTLVNLQLKAGVITREQAKTVTYQNLITRAVGVKDYVEVDTLDIECRPLDRFVLCSDGVHGYIDDNEQLLALTKDKNGTEATKALVAHALKRGGRDNATAIVVDIDETIELQ